MVRKRPVALPRAASSETLNSQNLQQQSQQQLQISQSIGELNHVEESALKQIFDHALEFNSKKQVQDLNLLDVLNSYDELIKTFNLTNEQNTKLYRKLLQVQRDNSQMQVQNKENSSSQMSTLNRTVTKIPRPPPSVMNSQFQSIGNQLLNSEYFPVNQSIDQQQQHILPHLSLFDSDLLNNCPSAYGGYGPNHYQSKVSSQFTTLQQQSVDSKPDSSRIKLPKLSFNDLIQVQNYESYKKLQSQTNHLDSSENILPIKEEATTDQEDESVLTNEFLRSEDQTQNLGGIHDDSSLMRYSSMRMSSEQPSAQYHGRCSQHEESKLSMANKFPKLKLISENENASVDSQIFKNQSFNAKPYEGQPIRKQNKQKVSKSQTRENSVNDKENNQYKNRGNNPNPMLQQFKKQTLTSLSSSNHKQTLSTEQSQQEMIQMIPRKENVIDCDSKLSLAFETKKLLLKAWKSFLIVKMHSIHKKHLLHLADAYIQKRLKIKYTKMWKSYIKVILPQVKTHKVAKLHYKRSLLKKVFGQFRSQVNEQRMLKTKLVSTKIVLNHQRLRTYFTMFKNVVLSQEVKRTQKFTAYHIAYQKRKMRVFRSLYYYAKSKRQANKSRKMSFQHYQRKLARKAFLSLRSHAKQRSQAIQKMMKARSYLHQRYNFLLANKSYQILKQYAIYSRQQQLAVGQRNYWLRFRYFKLFKLNCILQKGVKTQVQFVERYHLHRLLLLGFKSLLLSQQENKSRMQMVQNYLTRVKQRKIIRVLHKHQRNRFIGFPPTNGPFLECCKAWLQTSFEGLMQNVWAEFPKQRLAINPQTGQENILLNYLGLSKNLRYREFFFIANELIRKYRMSQVLSSFKQYSSTMIGFRGRKQYDIKKLCFMFIKKHTQKNSILRSIIDSRNQKRNKKILNEVLQGLRSQCFKNKTQNKNFYRFLMYKKKSILSKYLSIWNQKYQKSISLQENDQIADKIYRHRYLSKYIALWLKNLHSTLKQQHLEILREKFEKSIIRRRYLRLWKFQFEKSVYLKEQEEQINWHQVNITMYKCFNSLREHSQSQKKKKDLERAADQEYRYWMAKRAIMNLQEGIQNINSQKRLYQYLNDENKTKMMRKCFNSLHMFKEYRNQRSLNDLMVTKNIHLIRKQRILKMWQSKINQNVGNHMLARLFQMLQIKTSFNKIRHLQAYQDSVVEVMRNKQDAYIMLHHFNAIKKLRRKNQLHKCLNILLNQKQNEKSMVGSFKHWSSLYQARRRLYVTYAFTVIQLKNQFLKNVMNDWKNYIAYKNMKKRSGQYIIGKIKRKVFKSLKLRYLKTQKVMAAYDYLKSTMILSAKINSYKLWREQFLGNKRIEQRYNQHVLKRKQQMINAFKDNRNQRQQKRLIFARKLSTLNQTIKSQEFKRFRKIISLRKIRKGMIDQAKAFHLQYLVQSIVKSWTGYYKKNKIQIKNSFMIKRCSNAFKLKDFMRKWIQMSQKALNRIKAVNIIRRFRNKKMLGSRIQTWVAQTNYLISLDQRIEKFQAKIHYEQKAEGLKQLKEFTDQRLLNKQRNNDIRVYSNKKLMLRSLISFIKYTSHRREINELKNKASLQHSTNLCTFYFGIFFEVLKQRLLINDGTRQLLRRQRQIYGPKVLNNLFDHKNACQSLRILENFSNELRKQKLQSKALNSMKINLDTQQKKKQLNTLAHQQYLHILQKKTYQLLYLFKENSRLMRNQRQILFEGTQNIYHKNIETKAFKLWRQFTQSSKVEAKQSLKFVQTIKLKKFFNALQLNHKHHSNLRQVFNQVNKTHNTQTKRRQFQIWRKVFLNEVKTNSLVESKQLQLIHKIFLVLKYQQSLKAREKMIKLSQQIKSKAIVLTVFIQYSQYRQQMQAQKGKALIMLQAFLKTKAIQAFKLAVIRKNKVVHGLTSNGLSLLRKSIFGFRRNVALNNYVREKQAVLQQRMMQQVLDSWKQLYEEKLNQKDKLRSILEKFLAKDKQACLNQWKRGTFFMKMCEIIYVHQCKPHDDDLIKNCFREWRRLKRHNQNKDTQYSSVRFNYQSNLMKKMIREWKHKLREKIFVNKIQTVALPKIQDAFDSLFNYCHVDQELSNKAKRLTNQKEGQLKQKFLYQWMINYEKSHQISILTQQRQTRLKKLALKSFDTYRLSKMQDKYQMLKIIRLFSERRPELLLAFSKTFLLLSSEHCKTIDYSQDDQPSTTRICSTALAKYVIEKWKNVKDIMQVNNDLGRQADEFYAISLAKRTIDNLREGIDVINYKRSLKLSCTEFYNVNLMKRSMEGMKRHYLQGKYRFYLKDLQHSFLKQKCSKMFQQYFYQWYIKSQNQQRIRTIEQEICTKSNIQLIYKVFQALKNYTIKQQSFQIKFENVQYAIQQNRETKLLTKYFNGLRRYSQERKLKNYEQNRKLEIVDRFYNDKISKKYLTIFKQQTQDQKIKTKYSKLYSVFVAWKFYVKEKRLLQKYLNECNYQSQNDKKSMKTQKRSQVVDSYKENLVSGNDSNFDIQTMRMQQHRKSRAVTDQGFTPTIGQINNTKVGSILVDNLGSLNSDMDSVKTPAGFVHYVNSTKMAGAGSQNYNSFKNQFYK